MLQNTKSKGFTLVELLIVIVVIAILAAISIVAYNGIQNRGKATSAQSVASQVVKKAEMWNTVQSGYANYCQFATNTTNATGTGTTGASGCTAGTTAGPTEARLDNANAIRNSAAVDESAVRYEQCGSGTGARVSWAGGGQTGIMTAGTGC